MTSNSNGRRLRVAHVSWGLNVGGLEKLLVEFARHADRTRFDLHFVSLTGRGTLADDFERLGWPVTALEEPDGLRPGLVLRLAQVFRRCGADIVHTHDERPLLYGGAGARLARVPRVIHTRHGQKARNSRRQVFLARVAARLADRVVCVSDDAATLTAREGVSPKRICTIRNGIDLARFAYTGPSAGGPVVIVARLSPEKDVANLVRATAIAVRDAPSFRLEIAGDGVCMLDLKRLTAELGLQDQVRFLGEVREVPALLGRASLFALSSVEEGISLTLLEAMARGLPVVATRIGGNPEVVAEGQTGLIVPARDPAALAQALRRLQRDADLGRQMGLAGRQRVEQHFDVRRMVAAYESLYLEGRNSAASRLRVSESQPALTCQPASGAGIPC
ncbi:MAG TPA: glycosyltransferase [Gemmataceae bacterium]|nr:glycosyltransferase [Gemmataceae bacterium]